jgi:hypothetical protein
LDLAFIEGNRAPQFLLSNCDPSCGSQFFDAALTHTMASHKAILKKSVGIQQSLWNCLNDLENFHGI